MKQEDINYVIKVFFFSDFKVAYKLFFSDRFIRNSRNISIELLMLTKFSLCEKMEI